MSIIEINKNNRQLIEQFTKNKLSLSFRYFNTRTIDILDNHILTIVLVENNIVCGYGHIDFDEKYWLGICILSEYQGKGYGKIIMEYLLNHNNTKLCKSIHLTVDKTNDIGLKLYKKYNFNIVKEYDTYLLMNYVY